MSNVLSSNKNICNNAGSNLVLFSALLSILIANELSIEDQNLLSTLLQSIGENLAIIATVQSNCEEKNDST